MSPDPVRLRLVIAAAIIVVATLLRFYGITTWELNNDEIAEVHWSSGSFSSMLAELRRDRVHPPLDYVVQHVLGKVGVAEWVRRLPAVLCGIFTVPLLMFLGTRWHSPVAGLAAGFFIAIAPHHIRYSQEVRPYATGLFFLAAALVALELFALRRQRRWAVTWFAAVFLAGATLYLAGAVAAIASFVRIFLSREDELRMLWRRLPLIVVAWTILYAPWLGVVLSAARGIAPNPPEKLDWPWWRDRLEPFGTGSEPFQPVTFGSWIFWALVAAGIVVSARHRLLRTASGWVIVGSVVTVVILQLRPHYAHVPRYLMPAMLGTYALAGSAVATLWLRRSTKMLAIALVALFAAYSAVTLDRYYRDGRPQWRSIAEYVHERARPGETVILANNWVVRNFGFYWRRLPPRPDVAVERFLAQATEFAGPVWVVTGQCRPRPPLAAAGVMRRYPRTDVAEVRYVRAGQTLSLAEELCPE